MARPAYKTARRKISKQSFTTKLQQITHTKIGKKLKKCEVDQEQAGGGVTSNTCGKVGTGACLDARATLALECAKAILPFYYSSPLSLERTTGCSLEENYLSKEPIHPNTTNMCCGKDMPAPALPERPFCCHPWNVTSSPLIKAILLFWVQHMSQNPLCSHPWNVTSSPSL